MLTDAIFQVNGWSNTPSDNIYVQEMLQFGRFRIAPASEYAKASHIKAVKDLETARDFKLKAIKDVMEGKESFVVWGSQSRSKMVWSRYGL